MRTISPPASPKSSLKLLPKKRKLPSKPQEAPPSPPNPAQIKQIDQFISNTQNRLFLLRQQLQKQKDGIRKNKSRTKQMIAKKITVNEINISKHRDSSEDALHLERLRQKNRSMRLEHKKSLQDIQRAIYLVKLDDVRQLKNISMEHSRKMKQIQEKSICSAIQKKQLTKKQRSKAKARYMQYWKQKVQSAALDPQKSTEQLLKSRVSKKQQLKQLEDQQAKLKDQIQKYHQKHIESKKQYTNSISLPVRDLAEALEKGNSIVHNITITDKSTIRANSMIEMPLSVKFRTGNGSPSSVNMKKQDNVHEVLPLFGPKIKIPNTQVNKQKFSIILKQLKQIEKRRARETQQALRNAEELEKKKNQKKKRR